MLPVGLRGSAGQASVSRRPPFEETALDRSGAIETAVDRPRTGSFLELGRSRCWVFLVSRKPFR
jgi:hypothetical protein